MQLDYVHSLENLNEEGWFLDGIVFWRARVYPLACLVDLYVASTDSSDWHRRHRP